MVSWHDLESVRDEWDDAPTNDARLTSLIEVAKDKVIAYAPGRFIDLQSTTLAGREAHLRVIINLWNDEQADTTMVDPDFPTSRRYLEWKKLLRPSRGVARVR